MANLSAAVSNYGEHSVLLHRGKEIIDPLPIEVVLAIAKSQHWFLRSRTEEQIDGFFEGLMFKGDGAAAE